MKLSMVLPALSMLLAAGSSVVYLIYGEFRLAIYWAAAAVITASVTF